MNQRQRYEFDQVHRQMNSNNLNFNGAGQQRFNGERVMRPQIMRPGMGNQLRDERFKHNLAFYLSSHELMKIGSKLGDQIKDDEAARDKWLQIGLDGIDYMGIGSDKSRPNFNTRGGDIYAPTFLTVGLKVTCKLHSLLFPPSGFVETKINGDSTPELDDRANRIKMYFNYMTTDIMQEYEQDKKQQLWWTVNFGSTFTKVFNDPAKGIPCADYIRPEDIILDANASSLYKCERITHRFVLSQREADQKFRDKLWRPCPLDQSDTFSSAVRDKVGAKMGVQPNQSDVDKRFVFEECMTYLDLDGFNHQDNRSKSTGRQLPYVVVKTKSTNEVVAVYRNWEENDPLFKPIEHLAQHKYFTGFNVYGLGLIHMGLGLAKSETEIQNQLIKAAQLSNAPSLIQQSGLRQEKTRIDISPGSVSNVQTFDGNINNSIKQLDFKDPSPVMLELKRMQGDAIDQMSIAREIKPENLPANTAATTVLGMLGTMHVLSDSIVGDFYNSFRKEFSLLFRVFKDWLPDGKPYPFAVPGGRHEVIKDDFSNDIVVRPVMDPNVSAQSMQLIINDTITNLAKENPTLYDQREVQKRLLASMKVNDIDKILKPEEEPQEPPALDPVTENSYVTLGKPIKAYKAQNHEAHNVLHKAYLAHISEDQSTDHSAAIAELNTHISEHSALEYLVQMEAKLGTQLPDDPAQIPERFQNEIAVHAMKIVQKEQAKQEKQNPPPIDPAEVMMREIEVKKQGIELRAQEMQQQADVEMQKMQREDQIQAQKAELERMRLEMEMQKMHAEEEKIRMEMQMEQIKMQHEQALAEQKMQHDMDEARVRAQIDMARIEIDKERNEQQTEVKAYDSTLRFQQNKDTIRDEEVVKDQLVE